MSAEMVLQLGIFSFTSCLRALHFHQNTLERGWPSARNGRSDGNERSINTLSGKKACCTEVPNDPGHSEDGSHLWDIDDLDLITSIKTKSA